MRTSKLKATIALFFSGFALSAVGTNCLSGDECLRYSDCSNGLTCAFGKCVTPAPAAPASEAGATEAGSDFDVFVPPTDSGSTLDASTDDAGDADTDASDASDDAGDADAG